MTHAYTLERGRENFRTRTRCHVFQISRVLHISMNAHLTRKPIVIWSIFNVRTKSKVSCFSNIWFWFFKQTMTATATRTKQNEVANEQNKSSVRLSISCSATFEQLFRFGATFSPSSNFSDFVQLFSFLNNFLAFLRQFVTKNRPFKF